MLGNITLFFAWVFITIAYSIDFPQHPWAKGLLFILLMICIFWGTLRYGNVVKDPASPKVKTSIANILMFTMFFDKKLFQAIENNDQFYFMLFIGFFCVEALCFISMIFSLKERGKIAR
jgi:hypothetical protein